MSFAIGTVNLLIGQVTATNADGIVRELSLGDVVNSDDLITTLNGAEVELSLFTNESIVVSATEAWSPLESLAADQLAQLESVASPVGTVFQIDGQAVAIAPDGTRISAYFA